MNQSGLLKYTCSVKELLSFDWLNHRCVEVSDYSEWLN